MSTSPVVLSRYASKSNPSKSHEVRRGADGVVYCTCPSWRFQKNSPSNRTCKHIEMWKSATVVGGVSLATVMGPGPVAVRAPRKPRAPKVMAKPAPVPTMTVEVHGRMATIPCPPPRPTSWERINRSA